MVPAVPPRYIVPSMYQGFYYRSKSKKKQVRYEMPWHFFVCSRYTVEVGYPLGVLDQPFGVTNQVNLNVLLAVGTQEGQILEQVGDYHALAV